MSTPIKRLFVLLFVIGLNACGGGGGGSDSPDPTPVKNTWDEMNWDNGQWA